MKLPKEYECNQRITKEAIIKGLEDSKHKKIIRESVSKITLVGSINGEFIPSVLDNDFNVQVITFIDIIVKDKKHINELSRVLQKSIKNYVLIRFLYEDKQVISLALKKLNKNNEKEITIDTIITCDEILQTDSLYLKYISYENILNKGNKILFYREIMIKCFLITNKDYYKNTENLINSNLWYKNNEVIEVYKLFSELVQQNKSKNKFKEQRKKVEVNNKIKGLMERLEEFEK